MENISFDYAQKAVQSAGENAVYFNRTFKLRLSPNHLH